MHQADGTTNAERPDPASDGHSPAGTDQYPTRREPASPSDGGRLRVGVDATVLAFDGAAGDEP
jgi:hypothetical protein